MRLSKTAYYADFVIYAAAVLWLGWLACLAPGWPARLQWLALFASGMAGWTLLEYLLHRFVLHRVPVVAPMHDAHHRAPREFIGTPTWLTLGIFWLAVFVPVWRAWSFTAASGLMAGVMMGFLWYGILHHTVHHGRPRLLAWRLTACTRRHLRHHYSRQPVNFGVTTALWDHVFGTAEQLPCPPRSAAGAGSKRNSERVSHYSQSSGQDVHPAGSGSRISR